MKLDFIGKLRNFRRNLMNQIKKYKNWNKKQLHSVQEEISCNQQDKEQVAQQKAEKILQER